MGLCRWFLYRGNKRFPRCRRPAHHHLCHHDRWTNDEIKAALSIFFLITSIFTALGQAVSGLTTPLVLHDFIRSAPFTLLGVWAGVQFYNRINRQTYIRIMFWLLLVMGGVMLLTAF